MRVGILSLILVAGCSYKPVVDFRSSGDVAQFYQRDMMECEQIVDDNFNLFTRSYYAAMNRCLAARGHTVLSDY